MRRVSINPGAHDGFTLVELLVVIAIIAVLASLLMPALSRAKRKALMVEEMSSGKQLILAAQIYSDEHRDSVFPGYVTDTEARDDRGEILGFPINARYPWRLSPYLAQSMELIYCADNRAKLRQMRRLDRGGYVYGVSVYPSLGINSYFVGGNETEFPAPNANQRFGSGTVVQKVSDIRAPSVLMSFISARSALNGPDANGYFQATPPFLTDRKWEKQWPPQTGPKGWGFVAARFGKRAVSAMLDGHVETLGLSQQQDMRFWCNAADSAGFTLKPIQ